MITHWYKGREYKEVPEKVKGTCESCCFDSRSEPCFVHIWHDEANNLVVCGEKPVIFKPV